MSTASKSKIPVILLFGPTAVGKTAVIEDLCSNGYEIVNADSQQVYRYLNIGTAKPSKALLERIPHHLVDFLSPSKQFSVGCFVKEADRAIVNIHRR
ncbi:MAG: isopentenyl transferase family protein, partial [Spirochaetota bacterium]|nr:isopentenyl transferase family protein [Spirochaetota bacterium]